MAFSPQDQGLLLATQLNAKSGVRFIEPEMGRVRWKHAGFDSHRVRALAISPNGKLVATGDEKGLLRFWDSGSGNLLLERRTGLVIQSVAFSNDGTKLAVALWDSTIGLVTLPAALYANE